MSSKITPPPIKEQMFSHPGILSRVWTRFFQTMHDKLEEATDGNASEAAIMAAMETPARDESGNIADLNKKLAMIVGQKDYDAKVAEIERLLAMLPGAVDLTKRLDELESRLNFSPGAKDHSREIEDLQLLDMFLQVPGGDVFTSAEKAKLAGIEDLADVTDAVNIASSIDGVANKATPIDADKVPIIDTADGNALKTSTWTNIKAFLKTYFDTLYNLYVHPNHTGEVTSVGDGATTIANDAVTYAKMQNVSATDKVLGRSSAGAGDVEEIACTAAGRALLDDATAAAQATTLGLGTGDGPTFDHLHITHNAGLNAYSVGYVAVNDAARTNTALTDDCIVAWTALTATRNYQISSEDIAVAGRVFIIKDESGSAGSYAITVSTEGSETIDGADTISINSNYGSVTLYSNGSNLFIV